mgnify:FL=1
MKTFCHLIGKYFGIIAVVFLILGMTVPDSFKWVVGNIGGIPVLSTLLGVIMFGMGTTLNLRDFALVLKRPVDVFVGVCAQYLIMPSLAFLLAMAFNLDPALTAGVVLVGTCPGGTSSNVITFMSKGDLALSVTMTSVSTLLSPILTPLITYQLIGQKIAFDPLGMFWSIIQIVIIPICLGLAVKALLPKLAEQATDYLPAVSAIAISLIIAGVIAVSRDNIVKTSGIILLVVICHNCLGYLLGFILARITGMSWKKAIALSVEVGMQNSGLLQAWLKLILLPCLWLPFLELFSQPGIIYQAHCWPGFLSTSSIPNMLLPKKKNPYHLKLNITER